MLNVLPIPRPLSPSSLQVWGRGAPFLFQPPLPQAPGATLPLPRGPRPSGAPLSPVLFVRLCSWMFLPSLRKVSTVHAFAVLSSFHRVTLQLLTAPPSAARPCEHTGDACRRDGRSAMFALLGRLGPPSTATSSDIRPSSSLELSLPPVGDGGPLEAVRGVCPCAPGAVVLCTHLLNKCPTQSLF